MGTRRFRTLIVDDEPLARKRLVRLLEETGRVDVLGTASDADEALSFLNASEIDVLFLDIQMPGRSGLELAERLSRPPPIIFTTAHAEHALRAFEVSSVDYLLKPIEPARLAKALTKLETQHAPEAAQVKGMLEDVRKALAGQTAFLRRIPSRVGARVMLLDVDEVTHFFAEDKLTYAVVNGEAHPVDASMTQLEKELDPGRFLRIHRRTLVSLNAIRELHGWFAGGMRVRLRDREDTELEVARDRVAELKKRLRL